MKPPVLLLLGALALCAQDKTAVVAGSVVNSVTGAGIDGAKVTLASRSKNGFAEGGASYHAVTDADGSFRISGAKPGEYLPLAQKPGFIPPLASTFFGGSIHIGAGDDAPPLRLELIPPARLRGRVIGTDGKPAAKVQVAIGNQYANTVTTDAEGAFVFDNLDPGSYGVLARVNHVRTYYPAAADPALAEPIIVRAGADQSGYEIRLQPAPRTYQVRGVVLDAAGKPAPRTVVEPLPASGTDATGGLLSISAGTTTFSISSRPAGVTPENEDPAVTGPDGVFEFPALPERNWTFRVESEDLVHAVAEVSVRQDIDDLKIRLEAPVDLTGTVSLSDGSPAPEDMPILVRLNSLDGTPGAGAQGEKGALTFKNVTPGRFRIHAGAPGVGSYYVSSVMVGTTDATTQPVSLNAASPPIRVILKLGSIISGTVEKGEGTSVLLVPQTLAPGDTGWLHECGAGGSFEFAGLPPGEYYAVAVMSVDLRNLLGLSDLERLRAVVRDATSVRVDEGAVASVQLKPPR
jgi:Carboxypeptidase regulatory-like domain